ncbi:1169_t:CDS:2, partial [Scutellospora calospora]
SNSLNEFVISDNLKKTLDGSDFLIKDSVISSKRILLFTTQLYTIHRFVGGDNLVDFSEDHDIHLQPEFVLTDFELASINALQKVQAAHLADRYGDDEDFSIEIHKIPTLAFLLSDEISNAFNELKGNINILEKANSIIE